MASVFTNAFFAAIMAGIIVAPIFGFQIVRVGMESTIEADWGIILFGMAAVFGFQMVRPVLARAFAGREKSITLPTMTEPVRRGIIFVLIAIALVWPFFTSRGQVDIATLVLIYVMLGLG